MFVCVHMACAKIRMLHCSILIDKQTNIHTYIICMPLCVYTRMYILLSFNVWEGQKSMLRLNAEMFAN